MIVGVSLGASRGAGASLVDVFDYDPTDTSFGGGLGPGNFPTSFGGLLPTAGAEFFASGNGNVNSTFFNLSLGKILDGVIEDKTYRVFLNTAWYNAGQDGGIVLSDFRELYIGSGDGTMIWVDTPEPIIEDQWYTWEGIFTPAPIDVGQPFEFFARFDLGPHRDIALDLPAGGFAEPISDAVDIDIKPGSDTNPINLISPGVIPVAILGSDSFDVAGVETATLAFGPFGASPTHNEGGHLEDVNDDGYLDLVSHYRTEETGIAFGELEACIAGETVDETPIEGCDDITTLGGCGLGFELAFLLPPLMWLYERRKRTK